MGETNAMQAALLSAIEALLRAETECKDAYGYREDSDGQDLFLDAKYTVEWLKTILPHLLHLHIATDASPEEHAAEVQSLLDRLRNSDTPEYAWLQVHRILRDMLGAAEQDERH
jgi:hypothetical protein